MSRLTRMVSGKVREVFLLDGERLLMVATDRVSAFDVVMAEPIPHKGRVLTACTAHWLGALADVAPNHLLSLEPPADVDPAEAGVEDLEGRSMVVRRAEMLPVECIARGYLAGSAWAEYRRAGTVHGVPVPSGLRLGDRLPEPMFTPSTKAAEGHDVNIGFDDMVALVGGERTEEARAITLEAYRRGAEAAADRGILVADTKLELGLIDGRLAICDEVLTPDSSRFWPDHGWQPGAAPPAFDKQPLRDWLEGTGWDKTPPPPPLPPEIVQETSARYVEAYERTTGRSFADWSRMTR